MLRRGRDCLFLRREGSCEVMEEPCRLLLRVMGSFLGLLLRKLAMKLDVRSLVGTRDKCLK
jgi:hypothetical protein